MDIIIGTPDCEEVLSWFLFIDPTKNFHMYGCPVILTYFDRIKLIVPNSIFSKNLCLESIFLQTIQVAHDPL